MTINSMCRFGWVADFPAADAFSLAFTANQVVWSSVMQEDPTNFHLQRPAQGKTSGRRGAVGWQAFQNPVLVG